MDKYTIVIPTLFKSNRTEKLLTDLIECEYVDEIIIIDNRLPLSVDETNDKVRIVSKGENIYVNPAWNWGIELAKNNHIALLNDDINFDPNIFGLINAEVFSEFGIIGMGEGNYKNPIDEQRGPYIDKWQPGINDWGWGCMIMFHKSDWMNIPENIKIWYGDNFIKDVNRAPKGILRNFKVETEMSTTSDETQWDEVKKQDQINFINYLRNGQTTN